MAWSSRGVSPLTTRGRCKTESGVVLRKGNNNSSRSARENSSRAIDLQVNCTRATMEVRPGTLLTWIAVLISSIMGIPPIMYDFRDHRLLAAQKGYQAYDTRKIPSPHLKTTRKLRGNKTNPERSHNATINRTKKGAQGPEQSQK